MNRQVFLSALLVVLIVPSPGHTYSQTDRVAQVPTAKEPPSQPQALAKLPFRLQWGYLVLVEGSIGNPRASVSPPRSKPKPRW